jgi:hypothetical protein
MATKKSTERMVLAHGRQRARADARSGQRNGCCILSEGDARDPLFASFAPSSRARIAAAVKACEVQQ